MCKVKWKRNRGYTDSLVVSNTFKIELWGFGWLVLSMWVSLVAQMVKTCLQCGRHGLDPWVGKIAWRREQLATPWRIPWTVQSMSQRAVAKSVTKSWTRLSNFHLNYPSKTIIILIHLLRSESTLQFRVHEIFCDLVFVFVHYAG